MAFDISSVLKGAAGTAGEEQIVYLSLDLIDPDPANFYSLDGIGELAGNIELIGLQQPLRVRPSAEAGRYTVVSGHRRRAALLMIRDGLDAGDPARARWEKTACIVEYGEASEAMRELRLIYANAATRVMTSAEQGRQAERVTELLYQLKEQGVEFPGRMRDHVAEACRISRTKLARLHAIRSNLSDGWLRRYDEGELPEETAYQLSRLPLDIQKTAAEELDNGTRKRIPVASVVEEVNRRMTRFQQPFACRSHAGGPDCHWLKGQILRSLFQQYSWTVCDGGTCCRDCYHAKDCSGACQECKDRRALDKAVEKEKEAEREKSNAIKREAEQKMRKRQWQKEAKRVLLLAEDAGMKDKDELPAGYSWQDGVKIAELRKWAAGEFGDMFLNSDSFLPFSLVMLTEWAKKLDCSFDYLTGRTKERRDADTVKAEAEAAARAQQSEADAAKTQRTVSGSDTGARWSTGTPTETGEYVLRAGLPAEEKRGSYITTIRTWNGENWVDIHHVPMRLTVYRWIRLPEEE